MEFAITILINRKEKSQDESKDTTKPLINEKTNESSMMKHIMKVSPLATEWHPSTSQQNLFDQDTIFSRLMAQMRKRISSIPTTQDMDLWAVWIYLFLFFVFNCIYWNHYLD